MHLDWITLLLAAAAAVLVGTSKTAMPGLGVLFVPMMAAVWPARESTGALLPMLIFADVFAVAYYRRHADWGILLRLLPWVVAGIVAGSAALKVLDERQMYLALGALVISMVALQIGRQYGGEWLEKKLPHQWWFAATMGLLAGFTTMLGNLAGPVMGIYLIAMGLGKHGFMGTSAWFFLMVNLIKVPFSVGLGLITAKSLVFNLEMLPLVLGGVYAGIVAFKRIPQEWFNRAVLGLAAVAGAALIWRYFVR